MLSAGCRAAAAELSLLQTTPSPSLPVFLFKGWDYEAEQRIERFFKAPCNFRNTGSGRCPPPACSARSPGMCGGGGPGPFAGPSAGPAKPRLRVQASRVSSEPGLQVADGLKRSLISNVTEDVRSLPVPPEGYRWPAPGFWQSSAWARGGRATPASPQMGIFRTGEKVPLIQASDFAFCEKIKLLFLEKSHTACAAQKQPDHSYLSYAGKSASSSLPR